MNRLPIALLAIGLLLTAAPSRAADDGAGPEQCPATEATTVFVADATLRRHDGSASRITQAHREAEAKGWQFEDLAVYTENGDLQGFFITYTRPHPCNG
jgi:hypothetical protein